MSIKITGNISVRDSLKEYVLSEMDSKLSKFCSDPGRIEVLFKKESDDFKVEILYQCGRKDFFVNSKTQDIYGSFNDALTHLKTQLSKHHDKHVSGGCSKGRCERKFAA